MYNYYCITCGKPYYSYYIEFIGNSTIPTEGVQEGCEPYCTCGWKNKTYCPHCGQEIVKE